MCLIKSRFLGFCLIPSKAPSANPMKALIKSLLLIAGLFSATHAQAQLDAAVQAKISDYEKQVQVWANDPVIVKAVKAQNGALPPEYTAMTQEQWAKATVIDPFVRTFAKNPVGEFLKTKKDAVLGEAFISDANGVKVGFLSKPTNWSHKGKPKHEVPMAGKTWQSGVEVDESTGLQQVQLAVPVLDGGQAIGSLVVGLNVVKLK